MIMDNELNDHIIFVQEENYDYSKVIDKLAKDGINSEADRKWADLLLSKNIIPPSTVTKVLTRDNFVWQSGNIESDGRVTTYANALSDIVSIEGWKHIELISDSTYHTMVYSYENSTFVKKNFLSDTGEEEADIPDDVNSIRILLYDKPTVSYAQNQSDFKIILTK